MESYILHTHERAAIAAIRPLLKKLKIKIEKIELPYNPEFVAKIVKGDKDLKEGKGIKMTSSDFIELCK